MCACGCICVAVAAMPRPLFITSWCLRATGRRLRPRREECLRSSFSLVLPLSFLIACLRPFSPACHRRGRRHRGGCASFAVTHGGASRCRTRSTASRGYVCGSSSFHKNVLPFENTNQGYLPSAHAAMHSGADRVRARSTVRGSNR